MSTINTWGPINTWQLDVPGGTGTLSPIAIATQGALNSPRSVAAVRGHLVIAQQIVEELRGGDSSKLRMLMPDEKIDRLLKREDEEILAIIISFMENLYES